MPSSSGSSGGTQAKFCKEGYFYKQDRPNQTESLSEVIVSRFLSKLALPSWLSFVHYKHKSFAGCNFCCSRTFLSSNETCVSLYNFIRGVFQIENLSQRYGNLTPLESYAVMMVDFNRLFGNNASEYFSYMALFDAITLNTDRHWRNIGVIQRPDGQFALAPLFDFGNSLAGFVEFDTLSAEYCIKYFENSSLWFNSSFRTLVNIAMRHKRVLLSWKAPPEIKISDLRAYYPTLKIARSCEILKQGIMTYTPYLEIPKFI